MIYINKICECIKSGGGGESSITAKWGKITMKRNKPYMLSHECVNILVVIKNIISQNVLGTLCGKTLMYKSLMTNFILYLKKEYDIVSLNFLNIAKLYAQN